MSTRAWLDPLAAQFPASNYPQLTAINLRPALAFDASTKETAYWTLRAPQGLTGTMTLILDYCMASAVANSVVMSAAVEAVTGGDATDLDAGTSFDTANNGAADTVPGTAGYMKQITITLTTNDSIAAGDLVRVAIAREVADGSDTATGDLYLLGAEFRDAA